MIESPLAGAPDVTYTDDLVEISDDALVLKRYYFPFGTRRLEFSEIERIAAEAPTMANGRWRLWGSNRVPTWTGPARLRWFPLDWRRPSRDRIFLVTLANHAASIGFTVENSQRVESILRMKGLLEERASPIP